MDYEIIPTRFFLNQLNNLDDKTLDILNNKIQLLKINPFRFKKIEGYKLFIFRIRFEDKRKEKRLIYLVEKPNVKILCILNRDNEYKDLKKYLKKFGLI